MTLEQWRCKVIIESYSLIPKQQSEKMQGKELLTHFLFSWLVYYSAILFTFLKKSFFPEHFLKRWAREGRGEQQLMFSSWRKMKISEKKRYKSCTKSTTKWTIYIFLAIDNAGKCAREIFTWLGLRRQEQALQEAFRRADNNSEGKLTVDDYLKVKNVNIGVDVGITDDIIAWPLWCWRI